MTRVLLQPFANKDARKHYIDTIENPVPFQKLAEFLSKDQLNHLQYLRKNDNAPVWGVTPGKTGANKKKWEKIEVGDVVLFSRDSAIQSAARVIMKIRSQELAAQLWGYDSNGDTWEYIYLLDDIVKHHIPISNFNSVVGYDLGFNIQGFNVLDEEKSKRVLDNFNLSVPIIIESSSEGFPEGYAPDPKFKKGQIYNRRSDIHAVFGGQAQGGISTPSQVPAIFLFTGESGEQYGYDDGEDENGVFLYTGEGQQGDMEFVRGNLAIRDHAANGKVLYLFSALQKGKGYRYRGEYSCASYECRQAPDSKKQLRSVIVFHLVPSDEAPEEPLLIKSPTRIALEEARKLAYSSGFAQEVLAGKEGKRTYYQRSGAVRNYVLQRANGICESCNRSAPFIRKDGSPYLEPHHITRLSDAGLDNPRNVGAICPSCHREIHHGQEGLIRNMALQKKIKEIERSIRNSAE